MRAPSHWRRAYRHSHVSLACVPGTRTTSRRWCAGMPSTTRQLARLGFYQSSFHASPIGKPDHHAPEKSPIDIEPVTTAGAMEDYLAAYVAGWSIPEKDHAQFKANV